ncbi:MAG: hypothetical protein RBT80_16995 [Candidatus Vecturithrix sp.]|nr:hypothetical protein [Candidatus Vecturithrix sp.]
MMTWNYRIVRQRHPWFDEQTRVELTGYEYGIHEAFYDREGYVGAITSDPVGLSGDTVQELRHAWVMMAEAFGQPILDNDMIPEPGCNQEEFNAIEDHEYAPVASDLYEELWEEEDEEWNNDQIPVDQNMELDGEQDRLAQEYVHQQEFVGIPTLKTLIEKIAAEYLAQHGQGP